MQTQSQSLAPRSTAALQFLSCTTKQDMLFSVREGLPATEALQMASCFLASAQEITAFAAESENSDSVFGAFYLIQMAKAVVDSFISAIGSEGNSHE